MLFWNIQWSLLLLIFWQINLNCIEATWPSSSPSNLQLLGLFSDAINTSNPTTTSVHSRAMFQAAILLAQQYNITIDGQFLGWKAKQTGGKQLAALSEACEAISNSNILGIVGPAFSSEVPIVAAFAEEVGIPIISYAATDPTLSDRTAYPAFYRTVPSDTSAAFAIAKLFIRFNWTSCLIIYQNDAFGIDGSQAITEALVHNKLTVINTLMFDIATLNFQHDLKSTLTNSSTRIVVLWVVFEYTELILQKAIDADVLGPLFTWILSANIPLNSFNETFYPQLVGLLTIEPVTASVVGASINKTLLNAAYDIWKQYEPETFPGPTEVSDYALFAFDATWMLIQSLKKLCSTVPDDFSSCISFIDSSFCFNRRFVNSNSYFDIINNMRFLGVSGLVQFNSDVTDRINGSYYISQNSQTYSNGIEFVPVLGYSDYDSWIKYAGISPIIWPGNTLVVPSDNAQLNGVSLRIGIIKSIPYTMVSIVTDQFGRQNVTLSGYMPDLINLLQSSTGFIPNIELIPSYLTYDEAVQAVADGLYDILVADITITSARTEIADFSDSIYDSSVVIIMLKDFTLGTNLFAFLKPFSSTLWVMTLFVAIFGSIIFSLLEKKENEILNEKSIISSFGMSVWYCFRIIVRCGITFNPITPAGRLLTCGLFIVSLVLVASYTANLASDLTVTQSTNFISGLDDIQSGKLPFNRIGIIVGTIYEDFYLKEISNGVRNYFPLTNVQDIYDCLLNGTIDAALLDMGVAQYVTNNIYCNLTIIGADFNRGSFGIVMPKQWIYEEDLNVNILALREAGAVDNLQSKWIDTNNCPVVAEKSTSMQIQSLGGLFVVFAVIFTLSLFWFCWKKRQVIKVNVTTLVSRKSH